MRAAALLPALAVLAVAQPRATAQPAHPQDDAATARDFFERGVQLMEAEHWEPALVELQRSFRLHPTQVALFNIGLCLRAAHRYQEAIAAFERLLREFATGGSEERRALARAEIRAMRALAGSLQITASVSGAEVSVDGTVVGTSPVASPIEVAAGNHTVTARRDGFDRAERRVAVVAGETAAVELALRATAPLQTSGSPVRERGESRPSERGLNPLWFWSTAALTGIAVITTVVLSVVVIAGDVAYDASDPRTFEDQETGRRMMRLTDVALGIAVLAGAGTVVLYTQTNFEGRSTGAHRSTTMLVRPHLWLRSDTIVLAIGRGF